MAEVARLNDSTKADENITDTKLTGNDDGYAYGFIASGRVTQSFKGKFKPGQHLEFYVRAEHGYDHTRMRGDQIALLRSFVSRIKVPFFVIQGKGRHGHAHVRCGEVLSGCESAEEETNSH